MNEKFVINIGREFGSGGLKIAEKLSKKLGINFYDKRLIEIAAQKSGLCKEYFENPENKSQIGSLGDLLGGTSNVFVAGYCCESSILNESLFKIQSDIIRQLARKESCIFVGRCADYVLREHPRAINVFVCADAEFRIKKVAQEKQETDFEKIKKEIEKADKNRSKYYTLYTNKPWGAAQSYHLCINSAILGLDETASVIQFFTERKLKLG
ncbi:MAG: cytidylate kinase-like family protein [Endomicrobium sp.]|jgi:cytidylate kinase|nr:cytidylate kinase-like family protein [Endomicrobium sp.]